MMLATRIIPVMLQRGFGLVKGVGFDSWRSVGHARQAVHVYNTRSVDELIFLDIGATPEGRGPNLEIVADLSQECFMPLTVGGGVRSVGDVRALLNAGADKVSICTAAIDDPGFINDCAYQFGRQAIVLALDVSKRNGYRLVTHCGRNCRQTCPGLDEIAAQARGAEMYGAGEILLTSVDNDGTMTGYDLDLIRVVSSAVSIPVIANGGCGTYEHMYQAIQAGASAVAAAAMFHFTDATPRGAAKYLAERGVEVRL